MAAQNSELKKMKNWNLYEIIWLSIFCGAALILALIMEDSLFGLSTFITGIFCVLLAAKGNVLTYIFGMYNTFGYAYLSYINGFYGEMGLNILFFVPMNIIGFVFWRKRIQHNIVEMRRLNAKDFSYLIFICILSIGVLGWALSLIKTQNTPYIDATTNILSIAATFLMIWRYREQWILYIILNVFTIIMWIIRTMQGSSDGIMMIVMWIAFLTNAIYGYFVWSKRTSQQKMAMV